MFSAALEKKFLLGTFSNQECSYNEGSSVNKDSLTEAETEDELTDNTKLPSHEIIPSVFSMNSQSQSSLRPFCNAHFATVRDERVGHSETRETLETLEGCIELPLALQDFQEMFNDNDESYPPDFPMSLRS